MKHEIKKFKMNDIIYQEGTEERTMYLVKQGRIQLFNEVDKQIIDGMTIFSGGVIGELSFFDGLPRESSAKALMNCVLIAIKFEDMQAQLGAIPPWFTTILNAIVGRVRKTGENVLRVASKGASMDYSKKDLKSESYTYMEARDMMKIAAILSMVSTRYGKKGVSYLEINFEALKQFIVRFQLGTGKMDAALNVMEKHGIVKRTDLGEGRTKLELIDISQLDGLIQCMMTRDNMVELSSDAVRALNAIEQYLKEEPLTGEGRRAGNVVKLQHNILTEEHHFVNSAAFRILEKAGFIKNETAGDNGRLMDFSFDPKEVQAFLPAQKVLASLDEMNKER